MRALAAAFVVTSALSLAQAGCAQNSFLELALELPKNGATVPVYARVRVVSGDVDFEQDWQGDQSLPSFLLDGANPTKQSISIEGNVDNETTPVRVKINFCQDPNCAAIGDDRAPQVWLRIERAFYTGKRTGYAWKIDCVPNAVDAIPPQPECKVVPDKTLTEVPKCGVSGCRTGVTTSYCVANKHFCEE